MDQTRLERTLRIPLYRLYYVDDVLEGERELESMENLVDENRQHEVQDVIEALEWASEHSEYDFASLLPGLRHSNRDIYSYLMSVLKRLRATESKSQTG